MEPVEPASASIGKDAGRVLIRRARELFRVYPKALVGDVEAVHDARVAARRLRSALSLLAGKPEGRRARRADRTLRDLARAAGQGRDLDVGLEILKASPAGGNEAAAKLHRSLSAARSRARVLSREALLDLDVAHLRRDLRALAASTRVDRAMFASRHEALRRHEDQTIARQLATARSGRHPGALHEARRAARRLRYAAELAELLQGADSGEAGRWRKMQTELGEIQDRRVLGAWLSSRQRRAAAAGDRALAAAASIARARVTREAGRLTRAFFSARSWRSAAPSPLPGHPG
jgi:CHAD domain-containing protein